jgi:predicted aconitase with swiveling domain
MTRGGRFYSSGETEARAIVLSEPLSLWGGIEVETGTIINRSHPERGQSVAGRILVMHGARGSSSSSSVLAEAIRLGTAPAGILLSYPDPILTVGSIVAQSLYDLQCPIVVCAIDDIATGDWVKISRSELGAALVVISPSVAGGGSAGGGG